MAEQPGLPFPPLRTRPEAFVSGAGNKDALDRIEVWRSGLAAPSRALSVILAVSGPSGAGKTRLLLREAEQAGGRVRGPDAEFGTDLADAPIVLADDVHAMTPLDLFALIEAAVRAGKPLMIAGDGRLADWAGTGRGKLPDLASRLNAVAHAQLGPPDEAMLASVLSEQLARRGLRAPFASVAEAAGQLRREYAAAIGLAEEAERLATRGYKKPGALLRDALAAASEHAL